MKATRCPSELDWSRHLAGELGFVAARRLRAHVARCEGCRRKLEGMAIEREAFVADPRRRLDLAALTARAHEPGHRGGSLWMLAALAVTAAAAAVFVIRAPGPEQNWVSKGGDLLAVHVEAARHRGDSTGAVPLGATCAAGDRLMASYATGHAYLLLLERDGQGKVQVLLPPGGTASARLASPRGTTSQSFVLDDVPGRECFAAFFSDAPVEAARAGEALASGGAAPSLDGAVIRMQCCEKEGTR